MKKQIVKPLVLLSLMSLSTLAQAKIKLAPQFADSMILQRNTANVISGYSDQDETLLIQLDGKTIDRTTIQAGYWQTKLPKMSAGGPHRLTFITANQQLELKDVLFGDVWFVSGQSNMELPMQRVGLTYKNELKQDHFPQIRQLKIDKHSAYNGPLKQVKSANWLKAESGNIGSFSAVGYFFAKKIHQQTGVPVAIINNAYGGSRAQGWMSEAALKAFPEDYQTVQNNQQDGYLEKIQQQDKTNSNNWWQKLNQSDLGKQYNWQNPDYDDSYWRTMSVPGYWGDQGTEDFSGAAWYRTTFNLTPAQAQQNGFLELGRIIDSDTTYVNGVEVGHVSYQYPPRRYTIDSSLLKAGVNSLVVRIVAPAGQGGFIPDKPYQISFADSKINLAGIWKFRFGAKMDNAPSTQFWPHMQPNAMYNAMFAPLKNMQVKGVIWYQGESNAGHPEKYAKVFPAMIQNWRETLNNPRLPFIFTQLANYMSADKDPSNAGWAQTRAAQAAALKLANTAMITAIDVGEWNDIHPLNKKTVGDRFALAALNTVYGQHNVVYQGPILSCALQTDNQIVIKIENPQNGLFIKGEKLDGFAISNDGTSYQWVDAKIKDANIIINTADASQVKFVRYAWQSNPERANLTNNKALPAYPAELPVSTTCH
ncbi:sialate O-acetylesterase [Catenovulum sediminis]|uniref:sialate O-acetylesterase n=1 Tax=Catenovulum sediminis TaxID=1740262 RepID=UPI0011801D67|nr:sialate O-acetylesterase [Catenovulum sediminis]